jgi:peptidylprolyl isomerase
MRGLVIAFAIINFASCQKSDEKQGLGESPGMAIGSDGKPMARPKTEQVKPPFDLTTPPADAVKTSSGLIYKKLKTNDAGEAPKRNDVVLINYTGWHQSTGETFFTNRTRGQPMPLNLANTAPGFTEAMQLVKKGEQAVLWVPPSIGYKGKLPAKPETLVYLVEVVEISGAPAIPPDVAAPPATALVAPKSGIKYEVVRPGTGPDKPRSFDNVTYNFTAWDVEGHMFETTEMKKRPAKLAPYKQSPSLEEMLTLLSVGERIRFWTTADKMSPSGKPAPGAPTGSECYEIELVSIEKGTEPPATPPDVAKPPADAKKTEKGTLYKVLKAGKGGPKPGPTETVRVNYTGWTTDGRMFDSSTLRNEPVEFNLQSVVAGWTDGLQLMSVGDKYRFWIPEQLAYKGVPGRPQGMLVFEIELVEIKAPTSPDHPPPHHPPRPHSDNVPPANEGAPVSPQGASPAGPAPGTASPTPPAHGGAAPSTSPAPAPHPSAPPAGSGPAPAAPAPAPKTTAEPHGA